MRLKAMAKINLGLDVLGKREDGYHEVRMIMQTIRMYDILDIRKTRRPGIVLTTNLPFIPTDQRNLVYKAAQMLMEEFDVEEGLSIKLLGSVASYYSSTDGKLIAMPFNASTTVLYYNKDAVKKAGGDPDHFPTTWPEVAELAKKIKESGACKYGLTSGWQSWVQLESFSAWHNVPFATNNNGYDGLDTKLLFNSPLHVKHIDFLSKLQKDGVMVYVGRKSEAINAFTSGEAGILMNSSGSYAAVKAGAKFQWGVALLPYWPDVKGAPQNTVIGGAAIWAMAGHSKDAEKGAAAFLNYLLKPEVQARFHQLTGYVPVTLEGYELTKQQGFYDKNPGTDIAVKALSDKKPTINSLGLRLGNFVQIRNIIDEELEAVWAGKKTAKQALDAAVERGNAELARFAKANKK